MPWAAAAAVAGAYMQSEAAGDASDAMTQSGRESNALQKQMLDKQIDLNKPFYDSGVAANNRLSYLMGTGGSNGGGSGGSAMTRDQLRAELAGKYTTQGSNGFTMPSKYSYQRDEGGGMSWSDTESRSPPDWMVAMQNAGQQSTVDEVGLNAAIEQRLQQQAQQQAQQQTQQSNDPAYGSLLRNFTAKDMNDDPVYQSGLKFGLDEGRKGLNNIAAAGGSQLSGAALKALARFGNDYGSTKAQGSYDRFNNNNAVKFNRLSSMTGNAQTAAGTMGAAAGNYGAKAGDTLMGIGNAQAAGGIARSNAIAGGIGQAYNGYQQNQLMKLISKPEASSWNSSGNGMFSGSRSGDVGF